jgi:hypothetical protein
LKAEIKTQEHSAANKCNFVSSANFHKHKTPSVESRRRLAAGTATAERPAPTAPPAAILLNLVYIHINPVVASA